MFAAWVLASLRGPRLQDGFDLRAFGELPAVLNGRIQPLDSVARNALLQLRSRQGLRLENGKSMPATEWLMEVLMKPEAADQRPVFRIDHPEVRSMLRLPDGQKHFSFSQLQPQLEELENQAKRADGKDAAVRTPLERQVLKLYNAVRIYHRLAVSLQPRNTQDFQADLERFKKAIGPGMEAMRAYESGREYNERDFATLVQFFHEYNRMKDFAYPLMIPPEHPEHAHDQWSATGLSLLETMRSGELHPAVEQYAAMSTAYRQGKPAEFNRAVDAYRQWLNANVAPALGKGKREYFYNLFQPFYRSMVIYVAAFVLACAFWTNLSPWVRRSAVALVLLGLSIHTIGLIFRMSLEGRPPVTNLYSSAIFIGWGSVILGTVLERFYRDGIGAVTSAAIGFVTLVIAHNLALGGDTMEMMRAVLDTNFWLATHVTTVTLGYASTFVAGFLAILYILRGVFSRSLAPAAATSLARMVYGIICFATLFSFVGTILGGIWADQSWGRFWGWDPKENGALLIVIWNAAYLHARWGRIFPERGLMAMAVFGNIVTCFSWFGVNMLGIGLHSYGFMDSAFKWLMWFDVSQLLIIGLALLPPRFWRSTPLPATRPTAA